MNSTVPAPIYPAACAAERAAANIAARRSAVALVVLPASLIGGFLIAYGARYVRGDISMCVEELMEEKAEADRVREPDAVVAAVQVRNLDFSYGTVQVLFDVSTRTAITPPSTHGMSGETRTSRESRQLSATEPILSSRTVFKNLLPWKPGHGACRAA